MRKGGKFKVRLKTIKWSLKIAFHINPKVFIIWTLLSVIVAVLPAISLLYYKKLISIISIYLQIGSGTFGDSVIQIVILGCIMILTGLSGRLNGDFLYMVMYDYYHLGMQELLMESVQKADIKTVMSKEHFDEYKAVLNRAGSLTDFMSAACQLVSKVIGILSLLIIALDASFVIFIVAGGYICIVVFVSLALADKARLDMLKVKEAERKIDYLSRMVGVPGIAKEIRIYNTKNDIYKEWEHEYRALNDIDYKLAFWREVISFISGVGFYIFMAIMIIYSIFQVYEGNMSVDGFLMLYFLGQNLSNIISTINSIIQKMDRGLFALERQRNFILNIVKNEKPNIKPYDSRRVKRDVVFSAENLCFSYDNVHEVLHKLNFEIKKGEIIALVGHNGSGKSTLVKLLIDLYKPTAGSLSFNGIPYEEYQKNEIGSKIGTFFQNFCIYHASIRENIGFGDVSSIRDEDKIIEALQKGGADKVLDKKGIWLDNWLQRDVLHDGIILSGGEKNRIAISRAHMSNKEVLIFDEPAAALDPIAEMEQFQSIKDKISDRTAILISHRVGFARLADRIIVMEDGNLAEVGSHDELMKMNGVYAELFYQQAKWYDEVAITDEAKEDTKDGGNKAYAGQ